MEVFLFDINRNNGIKCDIISPPFKSLRHNLTFGERKSNRARNNFLVLQEISQMGIKWFQDPNHAKRRHLIKE